MRQNRSGSSHHFSYPAPGAAQHLNINHHHFQTMQTQHFLTSGGGCESGIIQHQPVTTTTTTTGGLLLSTVSNNNNTSNSNLMTTSTLALIGKHNQQQQVIPAYMAVLEQQPWFHGKITRKQAESLLENMPIGSFLVRQSESGNLNDFSLSLV